MKNYLLLLFFITSILVNAQKSAPEIVNYAAKNNIGKVKSCIKKGDDINAKSRMQWSALSYAVKNNDLKMAKLLLDNNAHVDITINTKESPLSLAAKYNYIQMSKLLIDYNADVNFNDLMQFSIIHWAAKNNNKELVDLLLTKGADINAKNVSGRTALDVADSAIKSYLISKGAKTGKELYDAAIK